MALEDYAPQRSQIEDIVKNLTTPEDREQAITEFISENADIPERYRATILAAVLSDLDSYGESE